MASTSSVEVKERVELYLCSPSGPSWPIPVWTLPLPFYLQLFIGITNRSNYMATRYDKTGHLYAISQHKK